MEGWNPRADKYCNTDKTWKHWKENKPDIKGQTPYNFTCMRYLEKANS